MKKLTIRFLLFLLKKLRSMEYYNLDFYTFQNNSWSFFRTEKLLSIPRTDEIVGLLVNVNNVEFTIIKVKHFIDKNTQIFIQ